MRPSGRFLPMDQPFPPEIDYPIPDPEWDYSDEWHLLQQTRIRITALIQRMGELETRDQVFDRSLSDALIDFQRKISLTRIQPLLLTDNL